MGATENLPKHPSSKDTPRHIIDLPFVQSARDVAIVIERAFSRKGLGIKARLNIVPDYFKGGALPSGLTPQQYLARFLTIIAEILTPGTTLDLDADIQAFVIRLCGFPSEYYLSERTLSRSAGRAKKEVDSLLFLACYTVWTGPQTRIDPLVFSLPLPEATQVQSQITAELLASLENFFPNGPQLRWRKRGEGLLFRIAEYLQHNEFPPELILHPAAPGEKAPSLVPWPEFFANMASLHPSKWHDLAEIIQRKREEHVESQFGLWDSAD